MMNDTTVRVLIADDQPQVRSALRLLLKQEAGTTVVGEASNLKQALEQAAEQRPDLLLLDWELPGGGGSAVLVGLRALRPGLKVIALSGRPEARWAALDAGVDAFISKGDPPEQFLAAVNDCCHRQHKQTKGVE